MRTHLIWLAWPLVAHITTALAHFSSALHKDFYAAPSFLSKITARSHVYLLTLRILAVWRATPAAKRLSAICFSLPPSTGLSDCGVGTSLPPLPPLLLVVGEELRLQHLNCYKKSADQLLITWLTPSGVLLTRLCLRALTRGGMLRCGTFPGELPSRSVPSCAEQA